MTPTRQVDAQFPRKLSLLFKPSRYKVLHGGRGSGKSWGVARALLILAAQKQMRILCTREVQNSILESVHKLLSDQVESLGLSHFYEIQKTTIKGVNGSQFIFEGLRHNINSIKSMEGVDICWVEEAEKVTDDSWRILIPTIRAPGSEIWVTFNPHLETDPTYQRFIADPPPNCLSNAVNWRDNPFFKQTAMYKDMLRDFRRDPDKYKHIWGGGYKINSEARVFNNWKIDDVKRPARGIMLYCGADWGFSVDPTVLIVTYIIGKTLYVWREAYAVGCEIKDTPTLFDNVTDKKEEIRVWPITADSARPETISHMKNHGYRRIRPSRKGPGSVEEGINFLKDYDIIVDPSCVNTIDELTMFSFKVDK